MRLGNGLYQIFWRYGSFWRRKSTTLKMRYSPYVNKGFVYISVPKICTIYNIRVRVVSDIQTLAFGSSLYIRYNTAAHVVNGLKNDSSYEFIGEVILKINVV